MEKLIFLFQRKDGLSRQAFFDHYVQHHIPLGMKLTRLLDGYTVNLVETEDWTDAVTEIWTASATDFLDVEKNYATPADVAAIVADHNSFIGPLHIYVVDEQVVGGEPAGTKHVLLHRAGEAVPPPPPGAGRVTDNRVLRALSPDAPDLDLIRMVWGDVCAGRGTLLVAEHRNIEPVAAR